MGVREKVRKKKEKEKESEKTEALVQKEAVHEGALAEEHHRPEVEVIATETKTIPSTESVSKVDIEEPEVDILLPQWGSIEQTEWMYHIPPREEDRGLWAEEWADFLLEWAQTNLVHVISISSFIREPPFKDIMGKVDSFRAIAEVLVDKEVAEWLDKKKRQLRIYWRPLEEWSDMLYEWALKTGNVRLDVKSIIIQQNDTDFATLPEEDLFIVMEIMVKKELAEWVDQKAGAIVVQV